jgi:hypothetical protein
LKVSAVRSQRRVQAERSVFAGPAEASGSREAGLETQPKNGEASTLEDDIIIVAETISSASGSRTSSEGPENGPTTTNDESKPKSSEIPPSFQRDLYLEASPQRKRSKGRNGKANPRRKRAETVISPPRVHRTTRSSYARDQEAN